MTISKKLILSMVALTTCILIATLGLARWSFEQGFAEFINGLERERLGRIAEQLTMEYIAAGNSWESIGDQGVLSGGPVGRPSGRGQRRRPPPDAQLRPKNDRANERGISERVPSGRPPPKFKADLPLTHLLSPTGDLLLSSQLSDPSQQNEQSGTQSGIEIEIPVVLEGNTIAFLKSYTPAPSGNSLASQFDDQQLKTFYLIGFACLLLTIALAFVISQMFVRPIKLVSASVSKLTQGKYELSLPTKGSDELAQLMRDTESLANTLDKARSQKNRWFADISHELRTPLTILVGEIEATKAGIRKFDEKQLASIEQEVSLLHRLVDDLYQLSLSDMGALKYEFNKSDISALVLSCTASFRARFEEKNISFNTHVVPNIFHRIDVQRFEQMLNNLLHNSLKYTNDGGIVIVSLSQSNSSTRISIEDSFPSVPEHECEQLFATLYQRNTSRNRNNSGAGLGLAICKNIAQSHHGNISARPSKHGGLMVTVELNRENER